MIHVSPYHQVELPEALRQMIDRPPDHDYVIRRISQKTVNDQPLIQGELVISGHDTLNEYPLAREYPVHFRKTYYPICFHQDPAREYENHLEASNIIPVPPPIGSARTSFRSCFLPGKPYDTLSPFGVEPEERNITLATDLPTASLIGLWNLLDDVYSQVDSLHDHGFAHGDLYLHNIVVSLSPLGPHLIDFEQAKHKTEETTEEQWAVIRNADLEQILKEAIFIQCALGRQRGPLADAALEALPRLLAKPDLYQKRIDALDSWIH